MVIAISDEYENEQNAGYGKPPRSSRFRPGQSGNPKGRPKGVRSRKKIVEEIANKMYWVNENGKRRQRSTRDFVLLALLKLSLEGNIRAGRVHRKMLEKYGPHDSQFDGPFLVAPEELTLDEWLEKAKTWKNRYSEGEKEN